MVPKSSLHFGYVGVHKFKLILLFTYCCSPEDLGSSVTHVGSVHWCAFGKIDLSDHDFSRPFGADV